LAAAPPPATDPDRPSGKTAATATLGRNKAEKHTRTMVVLTNASERRARIALECLGLTRCFKHVFGAQFLRDAPKPKPEAFRSTLDAVGVTDPSRAVIFEDSLKNAKAAKQLGMKVVFVTGETCDAEGAELGEIDAVADAVIASVSLPELVKAMPELWK
jgi:putative hydrolase of the HAD superfamily